MFLSSQTIRISPASGSYGIVNDHLNKPDEGPRAFVVFDYWFENFALTLGYYGGIEQDVKTYRHINPFAETRTLY